METMRFDALVRALGERHSRRSMLSIIAAGAAAAALVGTLEDTEGKRKKRRNRKKKRRGGEDGGNDAICQADQNACESPATCGLECSCFQTLAGDPVCGKRSGLDPCDEDADCRGKPELAAAVCVKSGPLCDQDQTTFCALPCEL